MATAIGAQATTLKGPTRDFLAWPFFGPEHAHVAARLDAFGASGVIAGIDHADTDAACR